MNTDSHSTISTDKSSADLLPGKAPSSLHRSPIKCFWLLVVVVLGAGIWIRWDLMRFRSRYVGFDEAFHVRFVESLAQKGLSGMPEMTRSFIKDMQKSKIFYVHPLRFLYVGASALIHHVSGSDSYKSLRMVSALMPVLILLAGFFFMFRWFEKSEALCTTALMIFSPLQLYPAQYALADGFFAFFATVALGSLWESLQKSARKIWPVLLGVAICCMILTKENAAFVCFFIVVMLVLARPLKLGRVNRPLFYAVLLGGLAGGIFLTLLAGGLEKLFSIYFITIKAVETIPFVQYTNDGPWYRYIIDYMAVSPVILLLAVGFIFSGWNGRKEYQFLSLFITITYLVMCNTFKDLRYAIMWDFPIRCLAAGQIGLVANKFGSRSIPVLVVLTFALMCFDLNQFRIFFMDKEVYEPVSINLFRAIDMIKDR